MTIHLQTNLDAPKETPAWRDPKPWIGPIPRVGERIRFPLLKSRHYFELEVCAVSYSQDGSDVFVELHIPNMGSFTPTIREFDQRLKDRMRSGE